ncbi:MAG: hypothetical protein ACK5GV_11385 [Bacteroidota bacterium]|jgi:hypothetical protein
MAALGIFKNAIKKEVGTSWTPIYTAPVGKTSYIIECDIASNGNTGVQVSVRIVDVSALPAPIEAHIVKNAPIPVGSAIQIIDGQKIVLESGDILQVKCESTGQTVDVVTSLVEDV